MSLPALAGGPLVTLVLEGGVLSCIAKSIWRDRGATAMPAQTHEESLHPALGKAPKSPDRVSRIRQDGLLLHECTAGPHRLAAHGGWLLGEDVAGSPTPNDLLERLKTVPYPGFTRDIVSFGLVRDIEVSSAGVTVTLAPTTAQEEVVRKIEEAVQTTLAPIAGGPVTIVRERAPAPTARRGPEGIPGVQSIVAV